MQIVSKDYYSNCLIEAIKAKLKDWKHIKITYVSPFDNEVFCPHFLWSDGQYDYDFGNEGLGDKGIANWTIHKGHIRKRTLGFNGKYKRVCKQRAKRHKRNGVRRVTLKNFLEQSVVSRLDCIENKLIQMMNEDNRQERVSIKFDIQSEIESILTDLGLKK